MKKLLFINLFLLLILAYYGQTNFHNRYGTGFEDDAERVIQSKDGSFFIVGQTNGFGSSGNAFLMKVSSVGNIIWIKDYAGINTDIIYDIIELPDHKLVMCGSTGSFGVGDYDSFVMKTDSLGNVIWAKTYGHIAGDWFYRIVSDGNGGFYTGGYAQKPDFTEGITIVNLDGGGNVLWCQWTEIYAFNGFNLTSIASGGVLLINNHNINLSFQCFKFSSSGSLIWSNEYFPDPTNSSGLEGLSIIENVSGEFLINYSIANPTTVANSLDMCIMKLNSSGNIISCQSYGATYLDYSSTILNTSDGGYMLCGYSNSSGNGDLDASLVKINSNGTVQWAKTYGTVWVEETKNVFQNSDKGFIFTGKTSSYGSSPDSSKIHLVKTDSLGNTACNYFSWNPVVATQSATASTAMPVESFTYSEGNINWVINNRNFYQRNICGPLAINEKTKSNLQLMIYPNPTNSFVNIIWNGGSNIKLDLINSTGELVLSQKNLSKIDVSKLPKGIYFLIINDGENSHSEKLCID